MIFRGTSGSYELEKRLAEGGEGEIYTVKGNSEVVAKVYKNEKLASDPKLESKIVYMVNNPPSADILNQIAWPKEVLRDSEGGFKGFIMPKLDTDTDLKTIYPYPPKKEMPITCEQKLIVAINICIVISAIHKAGYIFGDFNPMNIGVNLKNGHVAFFDTDSYHFTDPQSGYTYRCGVGADGYIAPELIQHCHNNNSDFLNSPLPTFTKETDEFALAIHIFKLLMNGYTPFNGIKECESASQSSPGTGNAAIERDNYCFKPGNKPQSPATPDLASLSPDLQFLFKKTFIGGTSNPSARATADEWKDALIEYKDNITKCKKDDKHFYYVNNSKCPYCEADERYAQSLMGATQTYTTGSSGASTSQVNFGTPVNIPPTTGRQNAQTQTRSSNNTSTVKTVLRVLLWVFFFPIMLIVTVFKSRLNIIVKLILASIILSLTGSCLTMCASVLSNIGSGGGGGIGSSASIVEGDFAYTRNDTGYTVAINPDALSSVSGEIIIPDSIEGSPVTAVAENGFAGCKDVTSVIIPDSVTEIGVGAFKDCQKLESITLPFIGRYATAEKHESVFGYIFGMDKVVVEKKYDGSYDYAINEKPTDIPGETWQYTWKTYDERYFYYYYIPETLTTVTITSQTAIPDYAFNGCKNIETITYNTTASEKRPIGVAAFQDCSSLKFGESGDELIIDNTVNAIGAYAFANCINIAKVNVSGTVTEIGEAAFKGCNKMTEITVPFIGNASTAEKEKSVFGYIFGMDKVVVEKKYDGSYDYAINEKPTDIPGETWQYTWKTYSGRYYYYYYIPETLTTVTITSQTAIPDYAFNGCKNIETITYNTAASEKRPIGVAAFQDCTSLKFGESGDELIIDNTVNAIGAYAFANCINIAKVNVSGTVTEIGEAAFKGCNKMTEITVPFIGNASTAEKEKAVFGYIFGMDKVVVEKRYDGSYDHAINEKPTEIPEETWQYTWKTYSGRYYYYYYIPETLTTVTITSQTAIPDYAFNGCDMLDKLDLPSGYSLGDYALQDCTAEIK